MSDVVFNKFSDLTTECQPQGHDPPRLSMPTSQNLEISCVREAGVSTLGFIYCKLGFVPV